MSSTEPRERKVVQTELDREAYERLRRVADEHGVSLKRAVREAIAMYVQRHLRLTRDDPLFEATAGSGDRDTDARDTDEYLAGAIDTEDRE